MFLLFLFIDPPTITAHPQGTTKTEGDNVTLSCNADGNPLPMVSWTKDGFSLVASGNSRISFSGKNRTLTILNASKRDSGEYRCVAKNSLGNDTSSAAALDIQCKYIICDFFKIILYQHVPFTWLFIDIFLVKFGENRLPREVHSLKSSHILNEIGSFLEIVPKSRKFSNSVNSNRSAELSPFRHSPAFPLHSPVFLHTSLDFLHTNNCIPPY